MYIDFFYSKLIYNIINIITSHTIRAAKQDSFAKMINNPQEIRWKFRVEFLII